MFVTIQGFKDKKRDRKRGSKKMPPLGDEKAENEKKPKEDISPVGNEATNANSSQQKPPSNQKSIQPSSPVKSFPQQQLGYPLSQVQPSHLYSPQNYHNQSKLVQTQPATA